MFPYICAVFVLGELSGSLKNVLAFVKPLLSVVLEHKVEMLTLAAGARVMRISLYFEHFDHRSIPFYRTHYMSFLLFFYHRFLLIRNIFAISSSCYNPAYFV